MCLLYHVHFVGILKRCSSNAFMCFVELLYSYNKTNWMYWFLKFIFVIKLYMFRTVPLPINRSSVPSWSRSQAVSTPLWHTPLLCVQWKTPDDGQRNCPKHVEFYSKNKFEKLVHLVCFVIRTYKDALLPERQIIACLWSYVYTL